jgi:hypothetical protein
MPLPFEADDRAEQEGQPESSRHLDYFHIIQCRECLSALRRDGELKDRHQREPAAHHTI